MVTMQLPDRARRCRRDHERHRHDDDRHAPPSQLDARLGHGRLVLQGRDRTVDRREDGPLSQGSAGDDLEHLDQRRHELGAADLVLQMLAAFGERDVLDLEVGGQGVEIAGRERGPHVVALGQGVEQPHHRAQPLRGPGQTSTGGVVEKVRRRAVAAHRQRVIAADDHVAARVPRREEDLRRSRRQRGLDEIGAEARRETLAIDGRAGAGEQIDRERGPVGDAGRGEHLERLLVDLLLVGVRQEPEPRVRHAPLPPSGDVAGLCSRLGLERPARPEFLKIR